MTTVTFASIALLAISITVLPSVAMVDQPSEATIRATPNSPVSVTLSAQRFGMTFVSEQAYRVPQSGILQLGRGTMELFWSAMPAGPPTRGFEFNRTTELQPIPFTIVASSGGQTTTTQGSRLFVADDVERRVVDGNGLVATLFRNTKPGCHPGVVVLGGSEGGVPEEQAAVLASHGLTTLALAYYGAPGLSRSLTNVPLEIVQRGMQLLESDLSVCPGGVALFGGSKGAELALLAASTFGGVRGVVALKPSSVVFYGLFGESSSPQSSWTYQGKPVPFANGTVPASVTQAMEKQQTAHEPVSYAQDYLARLENNTEPAAIIPVERIEAPLLLVAGGADQLWPSEQMGKQVEQRRSSMAHRFSDRLLIYPDAGHLIDIPYLFAKAEQAHSSLDVGGTAAANEAADEDMWPIVIDFLTQSSGAAF